MIKVEIMLKLKTLFTGLTFVALALLLPAELSAQNDFTRHNWYFGGGTRGIRFNHFDNSPQLVTNKLPLGNGGSAVANDPITGNLFFYTDGNIVVDASHQLMPGGPLGGNPARNQPVAICKNPAQAGQYYIFSANAGGIVTYAIVDSLQNGNAVTFGQPPLGAIIATGQPMPGGFPTGVSEAMIMLPDPNGTDFWLMTHRATSREYHFIRISATGITYPGFVTGGLIENAANFAYHAPTKRISVSPKETDRDIEILTLVFPVAPATLPAVAAVTRVVGSGVNTPVVAEAIYDTEFSLNGNFLYVSYFGEGAIAGDVLQYDLLNLNLSPQTVLRGAPPESYGLQMAPDSTIYHLYQSGGSFFLGGLTNTDSLFSVVRYNPNVFPGSFGGRQFPSFAPGDSLDIEVYFTYDGDCANAPTNFFPTVKPGADSLVWNFGDGGGSSDWSPVYTYQAGGTYNVQVTAYLNGQSQDTIQTVIINDFDTQISLVQDTTACSCELPFPKSTSPPAVPPPPGGTDCSRFEVTAQISGSGSPVWQWYGPGGPVGPQGTGNSATLQPDSAGYYYLVVTVGGCSTYAGVTIREYAVQDQRANIWYFGQNAGIDFNPLPDGPPVAISNPVQDTPEGTSTISDDNGQVIFFTNGNNVWDRNFQKIGSGIGGDTLSTQSATILQVPNDKTLFYIFTTQEIYGSYGFRLSYSLFDLKMNGGTGGMRMQNVTLFTKSTERITGNRNWLIAHEYGNNTFRAYPITPTGIGNPVFSSIGSDHSLAVALNGSGYMKLGPQNRLAVALSTPGVSNVVEVFDFNITTGEISNFRPIDLGSATGQVYGVEFGAGGDKLFATLTDAVSHIYEFAFDTLGIPSEVVDPAPLSAQNFNEELGALQVGPDGQIYLASNDKDYLYQILVNGDLETASMIAPTPFPLVAGTTSKLGLPNFVQLIPDQMQTPGISITGICVGDTTIFAGSGSDPNIDEFFWTITRVSNGSVVATNTNASFDMVLTPDVYSAQLLVFNRCHNPVAQFTRQFQIFNLPPLPPNLFDNLCPDPKTLDLNPTNLPDFSYLWETGDTTRTLSISQIGKYDFTITHDISGCALDSAFIIYSPFTDIDLGRDSTVCTGAGTGVLLNTSINFPNHTWYINNVPVGGNTGPSQFIDFSSAATSPFETREVRVEYRVLPTPCIIYDTIVFTIRQSPTVLISPVVDPIACGSNTGQLRVDIQQPVGSLVEYTVVGGTFSTTVTDIAPGSGPFLVPPTATLAPTSYLIQVTDQIFPACYTNGGTTINTNAFTVGNAPMTICGTAPIPLSITPPQPGPKTFRIIEVSTGIVRETGTFINNGETTANAYAPGDYIIEVTDPLTCLAGATVTINPGPTVTNAAITTPNLCTTSQVTAVGTGATTFDWSLSPAGSVTPLSGATVTVNPGVWNLRVIIDDGVGPLCADTVNQIVSVDTFIPEFTFDPCTNPVLLTAAPTGNQQPIGNYVYTWSGPSSGTGPAFPVTLSGNYTMSMQSPLTGCPAVAIAHNVTVAGPLSVTITTLNPPCEDATFSLLATPNRAVSSYQWIDEDNVVIGNAAQLSNQSEEGLYTVSVSDGICTATADLDILLAPRTPGLMFDNALICPDDANPNPDTRQVLLDPGANFNSYEWFEVIAGTPSPLNVTTQTYTTNVAGVFLVELVNFFNCESQDQTTVNVECDPVIVGPNAFRPTSGLNSNQQFRLFTFFIDDTDFQIYIFNRWGEMIFESSDRNFEWNGGYKNNTGQIMPAGTYSYVVRYKSSYRPDEGVQEKRGGVLLVR